MSFLPADYCRGNEPADRNGKTAFALKGRIDEFEGMDVRLALLFLA